MNLEPIAIVGIGCKFAGANDPLAFWHILKNGIDTIKEVPLQRWALSDFYDPNPSREGKTYSCWGSFIEDVDLFDAEFFSIPPREASRLDPQQRLLLEVVWEAFEDAGIIVSSLAGSSVGVFIGLMHSDYGLMQITDPKLNDPYVATGSTLSIAPNRISHLFDFRGPSLLVDTSCSSSLVAVHLACQSLWTGDSTLALAGGANLILSPTYTICYSKTGLLSSDGRCKAFSKDANGMVRGEGIGVVLLKKLHQALADKDNIYGLICGSAIGQDGGQTTFKTPSQQGQEAVIKEAYRRANISPSKVQYIEAHGTGTFVGDPIEVKALGNILSIGRDKDSFCSIGSVKTNIGHSESAAGIAGLIKVALMLKNKQLPSTLHCENPNPEIPFSNLFLKLQKTFEEWPEADEIIAGVNSFGLGGTNAHVVVKALKDKVNEPFVDVQPTQLLFVLSARCLESLESLAKKYSEWLQTNNDSLIDICYSVSLRRTHHEHRLALVISTKEQLIESLKSFSQKNTKSQIPYSHNKEKIVFVFSGQGSQWWAMGQELLKGNQNFYKTIQECDNELKKYADWSLLKELSATEAQSRLNDPEVVQPALFAIQIALAKELFNLGIEPSVVLGHSLGEVAASYFAEVLNLADAIKIVYQRGKLMQKIAGQGLTATVELPWTDCLEIVSQYKGQLSIAAINSPSTTTISGDPSAISEIVGYLESNGVFARILKVNVAFHSYQLDPFVKGFGASLEGIEPQEAKIPIISTVSQDFLKGKDADIDYWSKNLRNTVYFSGAIEKLIQEGYKNFLEISPHPVLTQSIQQCLRQSQQQGKVFSSLRRGENELTRLLTTLAELYCLGFSIKFDKLYKQGKYISLPLYAWKKERFWLDKNFITSTKLLNQSTSTNGLLEGDFDLLDENGQNVGELRNVRLSIKNNFSKENSKPQLSPIKEPTNDLTKSRTSSNRIDDNSTIVPKNDLFSIQSYLCKNIANVLGYSVDKLDTSKPINLMGLDSLMALEINSLVEKELKIKFPISKVLQGYSVKDLASYLLEQINKTSFEDVNLDKKNPWFIFAQNNTNAEVRVFCFPYSGSGATTFNNYIKELSEKTEVITLELPGHGNRLLEKPFTDLNNLINTIYKEIKPYLDKKFVFLGYSLGALLAFELTRKLRRENQPLPKKLFLCAYRAPQIAKFSALYKSEDEVLLSEIRRLGGTPDAISQNPEMMKLVLPIFRADLEILEKYQYLPEEPLETPLCVFGGQTDKDFPSSELKMWQEQTKEKFQFHLIEGNHFFLHTHQKDFFKILLQELENL